MKLHTCITCGYFCTQDDLNWDMLPVTWQCPECGQSKENFDVIEIPDSQEESPIDKLLGRGR